MGKRVAAWGMAGFLVVASAQEAGQSRSMPAPPALPYYDWKACPFEGCTYREWTARRSIAVYDTWETRRRPIATLSKGEKVVGLTGVVITSRPGKIRINARLPELGLRRGDTVLTYTYQGEGVWSAWFKGRFYPDLDATFARAPAEAGCGTGCIAAFTDLGKHSWWAQIRLSDGRTGWAEMDTAEFDGVDQLASGKHDPRILRPVADGPTAA